MNTINFRKTLIELALEENNESKIAKVIAFYYANLNITNREGLFESLLNFYKISDNQEFEFENLSTELESNNEIINTSKYLNKDFRIKNVEISNVRGIPSKEESDNIPYGINLFQDNNSVYNSIILANNGNGKSSIFSALEMIYANDIGEKNLRTQNFKSLNDNDYLNYLERFPNGGKPICEIETFEGNYSIDKRIFEPELVNIFNPKSHFITEFDIIENGRNVYNSNPNIDYSFHNIIAKNLGLDEFLNFINISEQIPNYKRRKEYTFRDTIQSELTTNNTTIEKRIEEVKLKSLELNNLKDGKDKNVKKNNTNDDIKQLRTILNKDIDIVFNKESYNKIINDYKKSYQNYLSKNISKKNSIEKNFLNSGKDLLHYYDNCPFCLDSNKSNEEINSEVEKRLKELDDIEVVEKEIRENFRLLTSTLLTTVKDLRKLYNIIETERIELTKYTNLDSINIKQNELYIELSPQLNDDELIDLVNELSKIQFPTEIDFKRLFNLIHENQLIFQEYFASFSLKAILYINERKLQIEDEIQKLSLSSHELSLEQKILKLEQEINEVKNSILSLEKRNLDLKPELENANKIVGYFDRIKSEIINYNLKFNDRKDKLVAEAFEPMKNTIEQIMNDFISKNENIKLEIKLENYNYKVDGEQYTSKIIIAKIIDLKFNKETTPDLYFNTFRFKLFCLMISLSIALATRIKYKINLPLVMDDLFYASDFINKISFTKFFKELIKLFHKYTPEMSLQFILFTHDDLVFTSAIEAIEEYSDIENDQIIDKTLITRMFDVNDKEEIPSKFENGEIFWNLLYQLPKQTLVN
ncbi:hypothetical protein [Flavobacterium sp.]|uniref:hypothetical protein n=1 Tax=Flavobacterium sp. TaxID=239 RepID=UPI00261787E0|nr:hypothetical protein [Flavobacterium sp.]